MDWTKLSKPILALAPIADMTDSPFCCVCRLVNSEPEGEESLFNAAKIANSKTVVRTTEKGSLTAVRDYQPFVIFREMVSAEAIVRGNEKTLKMCEFAPIESPIVLQLFGSNPKVIFNAAKILTERFLVRLGQTRNELSGIDINMGCPVPKIARNADSGAALMKDHKRAVDIVKALKKANLGLPISVKTRLGWSKKEEILDFAQELEQSGADALTIHGRTKLQGYSGVADWEMIGWAKQLVSIPVIANGDIKSAEDIQKCLEITGCDGVMIGRAALGNPWIFRTSDFRLQILGAEVRRPIAEVKKVVLRHAQLHLEHYGEGSMVTFRKHLLYYFKGDNVEIKEIKKLRNLLARVRRLEELEQILDKY